MPVTPPAPTNPGIPAGFKMDDGYQALVVLALDTTISLWPVDVSLPGLDGGPEIPTTTMLNTKVRTFSPGVLINMMESEQVCGYDPEVISQVMLGGTVFINKPTTITIWLMNGDSVCYYGWLKKLVFAPLSISKFPQCTASIFPSNQDLAGFEALPVYTRGPGTFSR